MNAFKDEIQYALEDVATEELLADCIEAAQVLSVFYYNDHELELGNVLESDDSESKPTKVSEVLKEHLYKVCTLHRVQVSTEATLSELSKLTHALLLMQAWEDTQAIINCCIADASDEEKLCALIALVGEITEDKALDLVEEVDVNFLRGLQRLYEGSALSVQEEYQEPLLDEHIAKMRAFKHLMKAENSMAFKMVQAGYMPGSQIADYFKRVAPALSQRENKEIAFEVAGFLMLGRDSWHNALTSWRQHNHLFGLEQDDLLAVDAQLAKVLSEFDRLRGKHA